jgi:ATP-dependent exoDNAse (exonuclease V) beta subunit
MSEGILQRLQEERRLMYVGITRAQRSLAVSWTKRRKKGRETIAAQPSRFIAEMALEQGDHEGRPAREAQGAARRVRCVAPSFVTVEAPSSRATSTTRVFSSSTSPRTA